MINKQDLIYPELSYKIVGCAFEVFNSLGPGQREIYYQKALTIAFKEAKLKFNEQIYYPLTFKNKVIGRNYLDYLVEEKIIVEIKASGHFSKAHFEQVLNYLTISKLKLAILINFGPNEVSYKRVVNFSTV